MSRQKSKWQSISNRQTHLAWQLYCPDYSRRQAELSARIAGDEMLTRRSPASRERSVCSRAMSDLRRHSFHHRCGMRTNMKIFVSQNLKIFVSVDFCVGRFLLTTNRNSAKKMYP